MRCPKCHYIGFDSSERCRNCGYDFSLTVDVRGPDLPIVPADAPEGPLRDFALEGARPDPPRPPDTGSDLPLFARGTLDRPVVPAPLPARHHGSPAGASGIAPRAPLAVRRASPTLARERVPDEPTLDLGVPEPSISRRHAGLLTSVEPEPAPESTTAPLMRRIAAALVDLVLIASIHAAVIYLTLRLCGLTFAQLRILPPVPLGAFLLMLAGGYVISFTVAGGQTIGKMLTGVRVVPIAERDSGNARVTLGSAVLRAAGCLVSILTAGLGYVPALISQDHRALHDRLADTRVVRV